MKTLPALLFLLVSSAFAQTHLNQCQPISISGAYVLDNDVTCTTQGFAINADNVSLDCGGHTVTFGNPGTIAPAISVCDTWFKGLPSNACGNAHHASPAINNCNLVQAPGSTPFTHAIQIGQGNRITPGTITNNQITIQEPGSQAIHCEYCAPGWLIQNNTIRDNVTNIQHSGQSALSARSAFQGSAIFFGGGQNVAGVGDQILGNWILGTPQGGIIDPDQNTTIAGNIIWMSSFYSNDYGVAVISGDGQKILRNQVYGRGRGIDLESSGWTADGNIISVQELATNSEYGGCELDGTDGIRLKNYVGNVPSTGFTLTNNTVSVVAGPCLANGLRLTHLGPAASGTISGNTFTTIAGSAGDYPLSISGTNTAGLTFANNHFLGSSIQCDWDGCALTIQPGQDWRLAGTTVVGMDGHTFAPESLTIGDSIPRASVACTANSSALIQVGTLQKQCP